MFVALMPYNMSTD